MRIHAARTHTLLKNYLVLVGCSQVDGDCSPQGATIHDHP